MSLTENIIKKRKSPFLKFISRLPLWFKISLYILFILIIICVLKITKMHNDQYKMVPLYISSIPFNEGWDAKLSLSDYGYIEGIDFEMIKVTKLESYIKVRKKLILKILSHLASEGMPKNFIRPLYEFSERDEEKKSKISLLNCLVDKINPYTEEKNFSWPHRDYKLLEKQLEISIIMIQGIENAKVMIHPPQKEGFLVELFTPPAAIVLIDPEEEILSEKRIEGVKSIFIGLGFMPADITIIEPETF